MLYWEAASLCLPPSAPLCNSAQSPRAPSSPAGISGTASSYPDARMQSQRRPGGDRGGGGPRASVGGFQGREGESTQVSVRRLSAAYIFLSRSDSSEKGRSYISVHSSFICAGPDPERALMTFSGRAARHAAAQPAPRNAAPKSQSERMSYGCGSLDDSPGKCAE